MTTKISRTQQEQRLRTLENKFREACERTKRDGLEAGRYLCEIRDECLWEVEFESWNQYLKERAKEIAGISFSQASNLIRAAEVAKRLPDNTVNWITPSHLVELARLAPNVGKETGGKEKDFSALRKHDMARVLKRATEKASGETPSVSDVSKAVDHDLGIDRASKSRETKRLREEADAAAKSRRDAGIPLETHLRREAAKVKVIQQTIEKIEAGGWALAPPDTAAAL